MRARLSLLCTAAVALACEPKIPSVPEDGGRAADLDGMSPRDGSTPTTDAADAGLPDAAPSLDAAGLDRSPGDGSPEWGECGPPSGSNSGLEHQDSRGRVWVTASGDPCARQYRMETSAPRRASSPNPRVIVELEDAPVLRTGHTLFDAAYALALAEARELSVPRIRDAAWNDGLEIECPPPGCFETGAEWPYVWTRDTGYALQLGLAFFDPPRGLSSLLFKVSDRREGGSPEFVQDTGTGGSWPISTDRVVLALGARALRPYLSAADRQRFDARFYEALGNTLARDRQTVFDPEDGLYRGEQSFLDWREQSYPAWAATDLAHIGMSKSLSTNVAHLEALRFFATLAAERGEPTRAAEAQAQAAELSAAIVLGFSLAGEELLSSLIYTKLDEAPARRFDLLGLSLAISAGVLPEAQGRAALSAYPTLPFGPPVMWPQEQFVPIYHNRAIWPFVTAQAAIAAKQVDHPAIVSHALRSLFEAAVLFLSNLENLELVSGLSYVEDGVYSGPVVGSERQLWLVGGYLGAVNEVLFGLEAEEQGLRVRPYLPKSLRAALFRDSEVLQLSRFPFQGRHLSIRLLLPPPSARRAGIYRVGSRRFNGASISDALIPVDLWAEENLLEIQLLDADEAPGPEMRELTDVSDYRQLFGPRTPQIESVSRDAGGVSVSWQGAGETLSDIEFSLRRNGLEIAAGLAGTVLQHLDAAGLGVGRVPCYSLESRYRASWNVSHRSKPVCLFDAPDAVQSFQADAFTATGGTLSQEHGRWHYQSWGDPGHQISSPTFVAARSGTHLIQLVGANGAGPHDTGLTAGGKRLSVRTVPADNLVAEGLVFLPQTGSWADWRESAFVSAELTAGNAYRVILDDATWARNMSSIQHAEA